MSLWLQAGNISLGLSPGVQAHSVPHSYTPFPLPAVVRPNTRLQSPRTCHLYWLWA